MTTDVPEPVNSPPPETSIHLLTFTFYLLASFTLQMHSPCVSVCVCVLVNFIGNQNNTLSHAGDPAACVRPIQFDFPSIDSFTLVASLASLSLSLSLPLVDSSCDTREKT